MAPVVLLVVGRAPVIILMLQTELTVLGSLSLGAPVAAVSLKWNI
jgi:hypothetical protein